MDTFCSFSGVYFTAKNDDQYYGLVSGTVWTGPNSGPQINCSETELDVSKTDISIWYYINPSTWTCGYYTTSCDEGTLDYDHNVQYKETTTNGALRNVDFKISDDTKFTLTYKCQVTN